jgi:hypothetical protein
MKKSYFMKTICILFTVSLSVISSGCGVHTNETNSSSYSKLSSSVQSVSVSSTASKNTIKKLVASEIPTITFLNYDKQKTINKSDDINKLITLINSFDTPYTGDTNRDDIGSEIQTNGKNKHYIYVYTDTINHKDLMLSIDDNYYAINANELDQFKSLYNSFSYKEEIVNPVTAKPVIYLYPTVKQETTVKINYKGRLAFTYPEYKSGWDVFAYPDGKIINKSDNKEYSYLFWDGQTTFSGWDMSHGYVVKGSDTLEFLQQKLNEMGLTPREYNEFIVYWLPKMANNNYNLITFQKEAYENLAKLDICPKPESLLRVFMVFKPLEKAISIEAPSPKAFVRKGFTVVEWGGTEIE